MINNLINISTIKLNCQYKMTWLLYHYFLYKKTPHDGGVICLLSTVYCLLITF